MMTFEDYVQAGDAARLAGKHAYAIECYRLAYHECSEQTEADVARMRQMWGVCLMNLGQPNLLEEARLHLTAACRLAGAADLGPLEHAIMRDLSRCFLLIGNTLRAHMLADEAADYFRRHGARSEYGATIGFKARIHLADDLVELALERFGAADTILQRADNRHFELYNLIHFIAALMTGDEHDKHFANQCGDRAHRLALEYGDQSHLDRLDHLFHR